jgi:E1A/CREB-binding protein
MLDKGIIERIVLDYKDIYKQALEDNLQSAAELPYFEGDFWPNVMEENIREQEQVGIFLIHSLRTVRLET